MEELFMCALCARSIKLQELSATDNNYHIYQIEVYSIVMEHYYLDAHNTGVSMWIVYQLFLIYIKNSISKFRNYIFNIINSFSNIKSISNIKKYTL